MTDRKSRRVVIINNIDSDNIDQAIFILKSDPPKSINASVAREAQNIIDNYIRQVERLKDGYSSDISVARKKKFPQLLFLLLGALGLVCVGLTLTVFRISL